MLLYFSKIVGYVSIMTWLRRRRFAMGSSHVSRAILHASIQAIASVLTAGDNWLVIGCDVSSGSQGSSEAQSTAGQVHREAG